MRVKIRENRIIVAFGLLMLLFHLVFTRLMIKTDDGNFLGIVNSSDFTYIGWLIERYLSVSGRTVGELLLAFFLKRNLIYWKIINTAMITYISHFLYKISELFGGNADKEHRQIFSCCGMFLMIVSCLNPSVFWYAGSFSYLWPFAGMLMTVSPFVSYVFGKQVSDLRFAISFFTAVIGTMQEQSAACCTVLYLILMATVILRKLKVRAVMFMPLIPIALCDWFMLVSPGRNGRIAMETSASFERYSEYGFFEKLGCGFASFFSNCFYLSAFLMVIFIALMSIVIYEKSQVKSKARLFVIVGNTFSVSVCILINSVVFFKEKNLPHIVFRNAFTQLNFNGDFIVLFVSGFILLSVILTMLFALAKTDATIGLCVGLCFAASLCSALILSFSPTVFSSGQRVAFFSNMFIVVACVILFSRTLNTKIIDKIFKAAVIYAVATFILDCFAFRLAEHPIMG